MDVKNKTIVVTGGGNGMGREMVLNLLARGARVAAADIDKAGLEETTKLAGGKAANLSTHILNKADKAAVSKFPEQVIARHGQVDGIINNAGIIQPFVRVADLGYPDIERVMNVNFYGTLYMVKAFLPHLKKRPEAHIVNISSMGGFLPVPGQSVYGASKAAVKLFTEGLYAELMDSPVKVSIVYPGAIGTNITENSGVKSPGSSEKNGENSKFNPMPPAKAAEIIIDGMVKDRVRIYVGKDSSFLNTLYRLSPGYATRFISKQMKSLLPA
ncbi:MAG: SDR family NAD(P)-dependent oxidoreductase [Bacteroidales bacterium]|nr:SDR family NAD(P)-dependent oxidoreductase [Bacteroidales bacterium]